MIMSGRAKENVVSERCIVLYQVQYEIVDNFISQKSDIIFSWSYIFQRVHRGHEKL